jgi:serine/threonine-protein kinase
MLGTPAFMSPEQAGGELDKLDERADVFGLGSILCVILTGEPAYVGKSAEEVRLMAVRGTLAGAHARLDRCGADAKLVELCRTCLSAEPEARPRDAGAVAATIAGYLAGVEERVRQAERERAAAEARAAEQRKRRRVQLALAATVLILLGLVGFGMWWQERLAATAAAEHAARDARVTAGVTAALREARERVEEAWDLPDFPDRMEHATEAAVAALRRGDDFASSEAPDEITRDLASARREVEELSRHTRLMRFLSEDKFPEEVTGSGPGWLEPKERAIRRTREALSDFGLDPLREPVDEVARAVASSRLRDVLLGVLLGWHWHISDQQQRQRLWLVIRSVRQQSGGAYARWQQLLDGKDVPGLVAFAASPDWLSFRSMLIDALFRDLRDAKQAAAGRTFARAALDSYPHDFWLHYDLADLCRQMEPPEYAEALRHSAAATVQRPDSAVFHLQLGDCYAGLGSYEQAFASYRKAIELGRGAVAGYVHMGHVLAKKQDWDGAIAVVQKAIRLRPKDGLAHAEQAQILAGAGKHVDALRATLAVLRQHPDLAEAPGYFFRYNAACYAVNCADGLGSNPPPQAERPAYRQQALALLTTELAARRKLAAANPTHVRWFMQNWLADKDLASVRESTALSLLPEDERDAWDKLWTEVRILRDQTAPPTSPPPVK